MGGLKPPVSTAPAVRFDDPAREDCTNRPIMPLIGKPTFRSAAGHATSLTFGVMGTDLSDRQRAEHRDQGRITGADGRGYVRRGTKTKRSVADDLVASGAPLVLDMYSRGQLEWFDGDAALNKWAEVRPYVISTQPTSKQLGKHEMWNAGVWEDETGNQLLYLTGSC